MIINISGPGGGSLVVARRDGGESNPCTRLVREPPMARGILLPLAFAIAAACRAEAGRETIERAPVPCAEAVEARKAIAACSALIESGTASGNALAMAYFNRGRAHTSRSEHQFAVEDYSAAIRLNPADDRFFNSRGKAYNFLGRDASAVKDFDRAAELNPNDRSVYFNRGMAHAWLRSLDLALRDFSEVIRRDPGDAEAFNRRGEVYLRQRRFDRAIEDFDSALALNPDHARVWLNRGKAHTAKGETVWAALDNAEAFRREPGLAMTPVPDPPTLKDPDQQIIDDATEAIRRDPKDAAAYRKRGMALRRKYPFRRVIQDFDDAIRLDPGDIVALLARAELHVAFYSELDAALLDYDEAIRLDPSNVAALNGRGRVLLRQSRYDLAMRDFNEAIRLNPNDAGAYDGRASAFIALGDDESGDRDREKAAALLNH